MIRIVPADKPGDEPYRAPDLLWDGIRGDLAINALTHPDAPGDFRAEQGLATQVLICLMTDARVEPGELRDGDTNRGWPGDSFDMAQGETPIGSKLWLLRRSALYDGIETVAESYIREALKPLIYQKVAVRADVNVTRRANNDGLDYEIALYGRDGAQVYQDKFEFLWDQIDGVADPIAR